MIETIEQLMETQLQVRGKIDTQYQQQPYSFADPFLLVNPFGTTPFSACIKFNTNRSVKASVEIQGDIPILREFGFAKDHELIFSGLYPNTENKVRLSIEDESGAIEVNEVMIKTEALPHDYPEMKMKINHKQDWENRFISLSLSKTEAVRNVGYYFSIIDDDGKVRFLYTGKASHVFRQLANGLFAVDSPFSTGIGGSYSAEGFMVINELGEIKKYYFMEQGLHHDVVEIPSNGNFLCISQGENSRQDAIIELDRESGETINIWDMKKMLDPNRPTIIDAKNTSPEDDWLHINAVIYEEETDSIIASARNQSVVWKFNRGTGQLNWILGPHDHWKEEFQPYLLTPTGEEFEWSHAQHSPKMVNPQQMLLFDNGNFRSYSDLTEAKFAYENYSRGVIYQIDEEKMTVEQIWQYGKERGNELFCPYVGGAFVTNINSFLLTFGGITRDRYGSPVNDMKDERMKNHVVVLEHDGSDVIFEVHMEDNDILTSSGYKCYRADEFI